MKKEILNDKFEQCPNFKCQSYKTERRSGICENEVRLCLECGCEYWRKQNER